MKDVVKKYCEKQEKETKKLLKKVFGYTTIVEAINEEEKIRIYIEKEFHKDVKLINWEDVKKSSSNLNAIIFSKYNTLTNIIENYINSKKIIVTYNDYKSLSKEEN